MTNRQRLKIVSMIHDFIKSRSFTKDQIRKAVELLAAQSANPHPIDPDELDNLLKQFGI